MEWQQVNRTDPDKGFINALNVDADSITTGYLAGYAVGANSFNGASVMKTDQDAGVDTRHFIGVAAADIAPNTVGRIQVWGFANSVRISNTATSVTISRGDPLVPGDGPGGAFSAAPTYANSGMKFILCSNPPANTTSAGQWVSGIIRHL